MGEDGQLLMRYACEGDVQSLSRLVVAHSRWLSAYLRGLMGDGPDVEDALQDVWTKVIRSAGSYRGGSVRAYFVRVARSVVVDGFRRRGAPLLSLDAETEEGERVLPEPESGGLSPDAACERLATSEEIRQAVRALPVRMRDVLLMRIEGELTFKEIAEELRAPLGSVLTWMHEATKRLKRSLGGSQ